MASTFLFIIFFLPLLILMFLIIYLTKTELGIDLFPDSHLSDMIFQ